MDTGVVTGIVRISLNAAPVLLDLLRDGGWRFAQILGDLSKGTGGVEFHFDLDPVFQGQVLIFAHDVASIIGPLRAKVLLLE